MPPLFNPGKLSYSNPELTDWIPIIGIFHESNCKIEGKIYDWMDWKDRRLLYRINAYYQGICLGVAFASLFGLDSIIETLSK